MFLLDRPCVTARHCVWIVQFWGKDGTGRVLTRAHTCRFSPLHAGLLVFAMITMLPAPSPVAASCNQIPGTVNTFRGAIGSLDRPFAAPGDSLDFRLSPSCDASPPLSESAADYIVTIVFKPPAGVRTIIALAADCDGVEAELAACSGLANVGATRCVPFVEEDGVAGVEILETDGVRRLRFRFPDTDIDLGTTNDDRTLAGSAVVAVTSSGSPLPCFLADEACPQTGLIGCVDSLYAVTGSCETAPAEEFGHFTALPPPNDFQSLCRDPSPPCRGTSNELRFTIDADGNALVPMDWRGILVGEGIPIARLLRGSTTFDAFPNVLSPISIPDRSYLSSFSLGGGKLPPIFTPQSVAGDHLTLFGSADAPVMVGRSSSR